MTIEYAYTMGLDCGLNGPSKTNSHYTLFATKELLKAWEKGKEEGERLKAKVDKSIKKMKKD